MKILLSIKICFNRIKLFFFLIILYIYGLFLHLLIKLNLIKLKLQIFNCTSSETFYFFPRIFVKITEKLLEKILSNFNWIFNTHLLYYIRYVLTSKKKIKSVCSTSQNVAVWLSCMNNRRETEVRFIHIVLCEANAIPFEVPLMRQ